MPVLVTGIHAAPPWVLFPMAFLRIDVDGRNKSGHDDGGELNESSVGVSALTRKIHGSWRV
jgi:hypothetical protein